MEDGRSPFHQVTRDASRPVGGWKKEEREKERKKKKKEELFSGFNCVRYTCSFHLDRHFVRPSSLPSRNNKILLV